MVNKNYMIGYRFQQRVKKYLKSKSWNVIIQPRSKFPDIVAWRIHSLEPTTVSWVYEVIIIECKVNKYLTREEKEKADKLIKDKACSAFMVAWRKKKKLYFYKYENSKVEDIKIL